MTPAASARPRSGRLDPSGYLFLLPSLVEFAVFIVFPVGASFYLAFTRYDILTPPTFIGTRNFEYMGTGDPLFWKVLGNTVYYSAVQVPLNIVLALAVEEAENPESLAGTLFQAAGHEDRDQK